MGSTSTSTTWITRSATSGVRSNCPTIGPKEHRDFILTYSLLDGKDKVDAALKRIADIQNGRKTTVRETPLVTSGAQVIGR